MVDEIKQNQKVLLFNGALCGRPTNPSGEREEQGCGGTVVVVGWSGLNYAARRPVMPQNHWT